MTEGAIKKAVADSGKKLCNVASLAANLELNVNEIKKHFPLQGVDRIVTGELKNGFAVVLIRSDQAIETPASIETVWSSHAYQTRPDLDVKERNANYIELLAKRPAPVIKSENRTRTRLLRAGENGDAALKEKASAESFFNENKSNVKQEKKSSISSMFNKITADKTAKDEPKENVAQTKTEQKSIVKNENGVQAKNEKGVKPTVSSSNTNVTNGNLKKTSAEPAKETKLNKSIKKEASDVEMGEDSMDEAMSTNAKASPRGRRTSEKRKNTSDDVNELNDDSDDEVSVVKNKKKKRRVAIESDSDDEAERSAEPEPKVKKTKQASSKRSNAKDQTPMISFKDVKQPSKNNDTIADEENIKQDMQSKSDSKQPNGKRRRRVLKEITHTFKDEEGYLHTKTTKEMVSETDSEPEDNHKHTATNKQKTVTKSVLTPKGQSSLFSFFKKQ